MISFPYLPALSPLHQPSALESLVGDLLTALDGLGGRAVGEQHLASGEGTPLWLVVTGGTEQQIMQQRDRRQATHGPEPALLIAHPAHNSLPAALETLARIQRDGGHGRILYLNGPTDTAGLDEIVQAAEALSARASMRSLRIGLVGEPSDWLVASCPSADVVRERWGMVVESVPMERLLDLLKRHEQLDDPAPLVNELMQGASALGEVTRPELDQAAQIYLALKAIVAEQDLQAVAVRCFDLVTRIKSTGCYALAQLNDDGIVAGCEGDLTSTVAMLWARCLLGQSSWMANPVQIDKADGALWLAHCTVPRALIDSYGLRSHFESQIGVALQGHLAGGPTTLVRIGGEKLDKLWLVEGSILGSGLAEHRCRTQVQVRIEPRAIAELLAAPLGNHVVLIPGHHQQRLQAFWEMMS